MPVYSVIVPCYNEEAVLHETHKRLSHVLSHMDGDYEIVYVNDGSRDKTREILDAFADTDSHVRVVHFARNAGHQLAALQLHGGLLKRLVPHGQAVEPACGESIHGHHWEISQSCSLKI